MKSLFVQLLVIFICKSVNAQSLQLSLGDDKSLDRSEELFIISNNDSKEFVTAVRNGNLLKLTLINESFKKINTLETEAVDYVFKNWDHIGHNTSKNLYNVYNFKSNKDLIKILSFDFITNKINEVDIPLPLKKQRVIQSFSANGKFYFVTIHKRSSKLTFYEIMPSGELTAHDVELPEYFRDSRKNKSTLYNVLYDSSSFYEVQKIPSGLPASIDQVVYFSKLYVNDKTFTLTADSNTLYTYIIDVNLNTFDGDVTVIAKNLLPNKDLVTKHNTFLINRDLYVMTTNADECYIDIWDIDTIKKKPGLAFTKNDTIFLENPVISSDIDTEDQLKKIKTKKILRNTGQGTKGISVCKVDDNYLLFIGNGVSRGSPGLGFHYGLTSLAIQGLQPNLIMFPTVGQTSANERMRAYLDTDFKLIDQPIEPNPFEKLSRLSEDLDFKKSGTLFIQNDIVTYVSLNKKTGEINIYQ